MEKYGLLGKGINYSLSPKLHKIIFDKLCIQAKYDLLDKNSCEKLDEEYIKEVLKRIKDREIVGINVTIPYKEKIIKYLDEIEENASLIGAVNTVVLEKEVLKGYNTDYFGIIETLKKMDVNLEGKKIYILGTGGASKAVVKAILDLGGIPQLISREKKKVKIFDREFETLTYKNLEHVKKEYLLVDTTPVSLSEKIEEKFENIFQMKYYLDSGRKNKIKYMDGLYMLVVQGIKSEELWQNKEINSFEEVYLELLERIKKDEKSNS